MLLPLHSVLCALQGFLFRFASNDVGPSSKARGIVDLSTVTDVTDGGATTGRPKSIKLSTANGHICYLCENETSQVCVMSVYTRGRGGAVCGGGPYTRKSWQSFIIASCGH